MTKNIKADERRTEIALARYTLLLPIVRERCRRARHQMRKNIAGTIHDFPQGVSNSRYGVNIPHIRSHSNLKMVRGNNAM